METNERHCLLGSLCKIAGTAGCTNLCPSFIALHGASGKGGRLGASAIPDDYRLYHTKNTPVRSAQPEVFALIDQYVKSFDRMHTPITDPKQRIKGLYLYSDATGTGKTSTACAILNTWIIKDFLLATKNGQTPAQRPAYYLDMMEFHTMYNMFTRPGVPQDRRETAAEAYYAMLDIAKTVPLLALDDIGVRTDISDALRGDLHSVIEHRVSHLKPTIYTSNIPLEGLDAVFLGDKGRLADRAREQTLAIHFNGDSKRGIRK